MLRSAPTGATRRPLTAGPARPDIDRPRRRPGGSRRARRLLGGVLVPLAVLLVAGCAPDNTPKEYNAEVQNSFEAFCTGGITPVDGVTTTIASSTYCQCAYLVFRDNVPYNDDDKTKRFQSYPEGAPTFQTLNNDLKDDPGKFDQLPDSVKQKLRECPKAPAENVTGGTTPSGGSTGTVLSGPTGSTPGSTPA